MDELDSGIIRLLQSDARLSNRELARRLGIAPSTCLERVRALTRRGVIRGYHADIDLKALNRGVQALIAVQVRPLRRSVIEAFKDSVGKLPEVMTVFVIAGGDDFLLHVAVQDLDHLHAFLLDRLSKRGEIVGFRTSVIYQCVHNTVLARLPDDEHAAAEGTQLTAAIVRGRQSHRSGLEIVRQSSRGWRTASQAGRLAGLLPGATPGRSRST
jgi:DNA-binding Lrp family transcriptional regulator